MDERDYKAMNEELKQQSCLADVNNCYIPQKGDLFEWCDEKYWCIESGNYSGVVNQVGETFYQRGFIWNYGGEKPIFIRKATEREFANMFDSL